MLKTLVFLSFLNIIPCATHSLPFSHIGCYSAPGNEQMHAQEYQDLTPDICYEHCEDFDTTHMLLSDGNATLVMSYYGRTGAILHVVVNKIPRVEVLVNLTYSNSVDRIPRFMNQNTWTVTATVKTIGSWINLLSSKG